MQSSSVVDIDPHDALSAVCEGSNEFFAGNGELLQPSLASHLSTTPMIQNLKDSIHHMLLSHASPMEGRSLHEEESEAPQVSRVTSTHVLPNAGAMPPSTKKYVYMTDEVDPSSSNSRPVSVSGLVSSLQPMPRVKSMNKLGQVRANSLEGDEISSILSVGSALSGATQLRSAGKEIIKSYNERINQK